MAVATLGDGMGTAVFTSATGLTDCVGDPAVLERLRVVIRHFRDRSAISEVKSANLTLDSGTFQFVVAFVDANIPNWKIQFTVPPIGPQHGTARFFSMGGYFWNSDIAGHMRQLREGLIDLIQMYDL